MKIYIAAPYPLREYAIWLMKVLEEAGFTITSRWLRQHDELNDAYARNDLEDVAEADVLLSVNPRDWANKGTGGRHVEFGYAYARGQRVVLFGERTNIFHHLSNVTVIESNDIDALLNTLRD